MTNQPIADEFPKIEDVESVFPLRVAHSFNDLRARAIGMERDIRFLQWQLACAQER